MNQVNRILAYIEKLFGKPPALVPVPVKHQPQKR
ncbi:MAG: hypothetical protein HW384_462 [Dehalococcoidia bacterium]|nr:hypothetical protein [Dehalococcoidia bacterium]MBF8303663.1 hypothetical protein [Dehalococcoidia bacterium]